MSDGQSGFFVSCFGAFVLGVFVSGGLYGGTGAELSGTPLCISNLFGS